VYVCFVETVLDVNKGSCGTPYPLPLFTHTDIISPQHSVTNMPFDENAPLLEGLVRPGAPRRPAKSSKQRGSILSNVHANRVTVFEEHQTAKAEGMDTQMGGEKIRDDRVQNLETAVKVLQKKGERTAIDQKTLSDRCESSFTPSM
jgi:hypothetical protein